MKRIILGLFFASLLFGCASHKQAFNSNANQHIREIALANAPTVDTVNINIIRHAGSSFGLIGGVLAAVDMNKKTAAYKQAAGDFPWNEYVGEQLSLALSNTGYQVKSLKIRSESNNHFKYLKSYPALPADAILDYYFSVDHTAMGATTNYVPTVRLNARLVDTRTKALIYEQQFNTGLPLDKQAVFIPATQEYKNIKQLLAAAQPSQEELKIGIQKIAQRIAHDLSQH